MKKSIVGSMVIGSICVAVIIFASVSMLFSVYVERVALEEKVALLENNVDRIADFTYTALTHKSKIVDLMYQDMIDNISANTQSNVMVFDKTGSVLVHSGGSTDSDDGYDFVSKDISSVVLSGQKLVSTKMFREENGDNLLTVGSALKNGKEIFGGVVFNQRIPEIKKVYKRMYHQLEFLVFFGIMFSAILFYLISRKITTPVKKISDAVNEFSKGNFEKRVEYTSDDELGELAENINHMATSLGNLEKSRRSFISDVSHELRTPMTSISGFVEGILDGTIPPENRDEYLEIVLSESKRLSRLVTNLLQVSRMENGEMHINKTDFDINELVRIALVRFEMMITPKKIDVSLDIDDEKMTVFSDRDSVEQILTNLINNAVKFTPEGGKISIAIYRDGDKIHVRMRNSGPGIEPEKLEFIWERFYKTDSSRSMDKTGVGLGLYIVKKIIAMLGESITVKSTPGEYTEFEFTLAAGHSQNDRHNNILS